MGPRYDVVVVGGGAAGLSAALTLARARRSVLVVDAGETRNAPAVAVHGYLGHDGIPPEQLLVLGRAEVTRYGGEVVRGTVTAVRPASEDGDEHRFSVELADGSRVGCRRVLLATGLVDVLPDVPGLAERWGRDVLHCPYCHGWELGDRPVALLATAGSAPAEALLLRQWTPDLTLVLHAAPRPAPAELEQLAARDVRVVEDQVASLELDGDRLTGLLLRDGGRIGCAAVVVQPLVSVRPDPMASLGLRPDEAVDGGGLVDRHLPADATGATAVPGVWSAGNVSDPGAQVVTAAAAGMHTATAINSDLVDEDVRTAVRRLRAAG